MENVSFEIMNLDGEKVRFSLNSILWNALDIASIDVERCKRIYLAADCRADSCWVSGKDFAELLKTIRPDYA